MVEHHRSGKLAVILHADVVGSTALVQQDEHLAHERIQEAFRRFGETIANYQGQVRELRGDALLAEFERASDAVTAALAFQVDHTYHLSRLKDEVTPTLRVGIAMGEVVIADATVTGAGVVLAQRVEQLADAGGLCITAALHEALPKRMPFDLENLGEQALKGFDDPVCVYRVELSPGASIPPPQPNSHRETSPTPWRLRVAMAVMVLLVAGGTAYWLMPTAPQEEPVSPERMAFPLPDKPSIAILPFTNMSGDPEQEYFADGMTDDLITDLSKISDLIVIASNSVFTYKGKAVKVSDVGRDLGVRYVLEGSIRRVGSRIRINAQFVEAATGAHLWAERYDRDVNDVFAVQDEVTRNIVAALAVTLKPVESVDVFRRETNNLEAYDNVLQGRQQLARITREGVAKAKAHFERAIELDPDYARAYINLGILHVDEWKIWGLDRDKNLDRAIELGRRAAALNARSAGAHVLTALGLQWKGQHAEAEKEAEKALGLNPTHPETLGNLGNFLRRSGRALEAVEVLKKAIRLDPFHPPVYLLALGDAYFTLRRYEDAIRVLKEGTSREPDYISNYVYLAESYAMAGRGGEAKRAVAQILRLNPGFTLAKYKAHISVSMIDKAQVERKIAALRIAGAPE